MLLRQTALNRGMAPLQSIQFSLCMIIVNENVFFHFIMCPVLVKHCARPNTREIGMHTILTQDTKFYDEHR